MKADGPIGVPTSKGQAEVHSLERGELCLQTSWHPTSKGQISKGESLMKEILDFIFGDEKKLDNGRLGWLDGLELDRYYYYPDLGIIFEYQEFQHSYFLKAQRERDKLKAKLCRRRKVILVKVEYWALSIGQVCQRILARCEKRRGWGQSGNVAEMVGAKLSKDVGGKARRDLNARCAEYKKVIQLAGGRFSRPRLRDHHRRAERGAARRGGQKVLGR